MFCSGKLPHPLSNRLHPYPPSRRKLPFFRQRGRKSRRLRKKSRRPAGKIVRTRPLLLDFRGIGAIIQAK
nr:MAG TPA: hypothetical protein [Caudoviricetes sp.]